MVNLSKNHDFFKNEEKLEASCMHSLLELATYSDWLQIYATEYEIWWCLNLGQFIQKTNIMNFATNKEQSGAYCMHSLLKAGNNLLRLTAYMPLIMKWGVAKVWDFILGHFLVNLLTCPKIISFCQKWRKIRDLLYAMHTLSKASNLFRLAS